MEEKKCKYTLHTSGDEDYESSESEYESAEGTIYKPGDDIGIGEFSRARGFYSKENQDKTKAVLKPAEPEKVDFKEINRKYKFFKTLYQNQGVHLSESESTYRLVLPLLPGELFQKIIIAHEEEARTMFLSAIRALRNCHQNGLIVIDLKEDNILYDKETDHSYLIDGGFSVKSGRMIAEIFQQKSQEDIENKIKDYSFYAPECFSLDRVLATEAMDIYSLGSMMKYLTESILAPDVRELCYTCINQDPTQRPTLDELELKLIEIANEIQIQVAEKQKLIDAAINTINNIKIDCKGDAIEHSIAACSSYLFYEASETLIDVVKKEPLTPKKNLRITGAYSNKLDEISEAIEGWKSKISYLSSIHFNKHLENFNAICSAINQDDRPLAIAFSKALEQAKFQFLESKEDEDSAKNTFIQECKAAISTVKPILGKHLNWGEAIAKFLIELLAYISYGLTTRWGLFVPKSNAEQEAETLHTKLDFNHQ
ncbi:MAG: hypothetical protein H0U73_06925 [Tatlockia sp.]|nr:hypothetical protein [Tatlockia sp.]